MKIAGRRGVVFFPDPCAASAIGHTVPQPGGRIERG
jgi:hypothetical protein